MQQPARVLGPFDATCIVIGAIIGVGIFFNPAKVAAPVETPTLALACWGLGGLLALCGALAFAELGRRYHASGAQYEVLRDAAGPLPAFLYVFCNATAIQAGAIAVIAVVCAQNLAIAAGVPGSPLVVPAGVALIVALVVANVAGVRWGSRIQNLTVVAKLLTLLAIIAIALTLAPARPATAPAPPPSALPGVLGVLAGLVHTFFAYGGFQHALWIGGEVRDPRRNVPRAIVVGVLIVVAVYVLANWAYLRLLGHDGVAGSKGLAAEAVGAAWPGAGRVVAGAVALSAFGVLNAQLLSGPRLVYGMARDGRFFRPFAALHPRFGTPVAAIVLLGVMAVALLLAAGFGGVDKLTTGVVFIDGVFFALTAASVLILRARRAWPQAQGRAVPGATAAAAVFFVGELGLLTGAYLDPSTRSAAFIGVGWIVVAAGVYLVRFRSKR
ncbi:MAG: amino acid permease [Phycisphaerae bacterium]|nr:amino acid permease [Phycisphaerae bacterium]